jgi:transposase-like protein
VATNDDIRITKLRRVTKRRSDAESEWRERILECHSVGIPLRRIGQAAGVSHVRVLQIVRGQ